MKSNSDENKIIVLNYIKSPNNFKIIFQFLDTIFEVSLHFVRKKLVRIRQQYTNQIFFKKLRGEKNILDKRPIRVYTITNG